jgi:hypothetical protein
MHGTGAVGFVFDVALSLLSLLLNVVIQLILSDVQVGWGGMGQAGPWVHGSGAVGLVLGVALSLLLNMRRPAHPFRCAGGLGGYGAGGSMGMLISSHGCMCQLP